MRREDLSVLGRLSAVLVVVAVVFPSNTMATPVHATRRSDAPPTAAQKLRPGIPEAEGTPLQQALKAAIEERRAQDLPVPASVSYDYEVVAGDKGRAATRAGESIRIVGTTAIHFDHPEQAGFVRWPDVVIEDDLPPNASGTVLPGDYTQRVREALERKFPGIWEQHEYGYEPRRYTFRETFVITHPPEGLQGSLLERMEVSDSSTFGQILMGFSYPGPDIDYTLEEEWEECVLGVCVTVARAKAGLEVGWSLGLRLPVEVSLTTPSEMNQGCAYWLTSAITPLDWTASDYASAGVAAEGGNEYLLQFVFFVGFKVWILGATVVDAAIDMDYDASQSFTTPFGPGEAFPILPVDLPPDLTGLQVTFYDIASLGIGLVFEPRVGSTDITADWQAVPGSDASGSGPITYTHPGAPVSFGPVTAADLGASDQAQLRLMGFRYWFNEFFIGLSGYLQFAVFGYGIKSGNFKIADFYLADLIGGLWVGAHENTPDSVESSVRVGPPLGPLEHSRYLPLIRY